MKKVYIFLAEGFEDIEALTVVDLMRRAGIEICTVSVSGKRILTTSHGVELKSDLLFEETDFSDADMLVLPGGMPGTKYLAGHKPLSELLVSFHNKGGRIGAICAAPTVLSSLGLLKGRRATAYPARLSELDCAEKSVEKVVTDGSLTTSRGLGTAIDFSLSLIEQLLGRERADEIASSIVYSR